MQTRCVLLRLEATESDKLKTALMTHDKQMLDTYFSMLLLCSPGYAAVLAHSITVYI